MRYSIEEDIPLVDRIEKLLHEKLLPSADAPFADRFRGCLSSKQYIQALQSRRSLLLKVFKTQSVVDADMQFHTMSVKEWGNFVGKLGLKAFSHRQSRDVFWRAQGAFGALPLCQLFDRSATFSVLHINHTVFASPRRHGR
eukprot:SAG11_NODE_1017_length_6163_cov_6.440303_4_plen_141_part_00